MLGVMVGVWKGLAVQLSVIVGVREGVTVLDGVMVLVCVMVGVTVGVGMTMAMVTSDPALCVSDSDSSIWLPPSTPLKYML
jgi:hypothetical protein